MGEEYLKCDKCGQEFHDKESIDSAKKYAEKWKEILARDGETPRGLVSCPIMQCRGELILITK